MIDTPLEEQLRLYADELDATGPGAGAVAGSNVRRLRPRRTHLWLLSAAAACAVLIALAALGNRDPVAVDTGDFVAEPSPDVGPRPTGAVKTVDGADSATGEPGERVRRYLLPDPENWAVVEYWPDDTPDREQVDFARIGEGGYPDLSFRITSSASERSRESFDDELAEAIVFSDAVRGVRIGDVDGWVIEGAGSAESTYVLAWAEGWVYHWQAHRKSDLVVELLADVTTVDVQQWQAAIAARHDNVAEAVSATISEEGIPTTGLEPPPELPRYILPDRWQLEWVTDRGIFTDEQRAQEAGFGASTMIDRPAARARIQTFEFSQEFTREVPLARGVVPSVYVSAFETAGTADLRPVASHLSVPVSIVGLEGYAHTDATGWVTSIELYGPSVMVNVAVRPDSAADLGEFAESLVARAGGHVDGFDSIDNRYTLVSDNVLAPAVTPDDLLAPATTWTASWRRADDPGRTTIQVEKLPLDEFGFWLAFSNTQVDLAAVDVVESEGAITARADTARFALRYDSRTELLTIVTSTVPGTSATDILEDEIVEIPLADWIPLVTPYNTPVLGGR